MSGCDWYFDPEDYDPDLEDEIIYRVRSDPNLDWFTKKELILCWFDTVYGEAAGLTIDVTYARHRAGEWLEENGFRSFEHFLHAPGY